MINILATHKSLLTAICLCILSGCTATKELPSRVPPKTLNVQMVNTTEVDSQPSQFVFCSQNGAWRCSQITEKTRLTIKEKHRRKTEFELEKSIGKEDEHFVIVQNDMADSVAQGTNLFRLFFEFDSAELSSESIEKIKEIVALDKDEIVGEILINGFTDDIGAKNYNDTLALERANAVKNKLKSLGVNNRLELTGQGKCCFLSDNESEVGRAKNRRVEILLMERAAD